MSIGLSTLAYEPATIPCLTFSGWMCSEISVILLFSGYAAYLPHRQYQSHWASGQPTSPDAVHAPLLHCVPFFLQLCVALLHSLAEHLFPVASGACLHACLALVLASPSRHHEGTRRAPKESRNTCSSAASLCAPSSYRRLPSPSTCVVLVQPLSVCPLQ